MVTQLLSDSEYGRMADEVVDVLARVGYLVDHPKLKAMALAAGCVESAKGRLLFAKGQVDELRRKLAGAPAAKPPETKLADKGRRVLRAGFGNLTPKYYDHPSRTARPVDTAAFTDLVKFAHAEERVGSVTPLARQDVDPRWESLEDIVLIAELTDKDIGGTDPIVPEAIPYLAEMAEALGKPMSFIGACNCVNPPLRLERRSAET